MVGIAVVAALAGGLVGCGSAEPSSSPPRTSTSPSATGSTTAPVTTTATATASPTSGPLPGLLLDLAEAARAVRDRSAISTAQGALQDAVTATRTGVRTTREAAFGASTRDCGAVRERAAATGASADVARAAADTLDPMLATRQSALDRLAATIAAVEAEATGRPATATSPTPAELAAALDVARTEHASGVEALAGSLAQAADGRTKASELAAQAQEISSSAC
jgi:hypothetical protein